MAVEAKLNSNVTVNETITLSNVPAVSSASVVVKHDQYNDDEFINATSTVPATKVAAFEQALTAGAATIDLTNMTGTDGDAVTGLGLKLQILKLRNKSTNAGAITITDGLSNGYIGLGNSFLLELGVGAHALFFLNDTADDVGASVKTLDLAGTGTDVLEVIAVFG